MQRRKDAIRGTSKRKPAAKNLPAAAKLAETAAAITPRSKTFPIVGIGASAGGVEAVTQFLKALAPDTGMAFVLIQHLDPQRKSMLAAIFGRVTGMTVVEATDGQAVEPDHLFIIPPNKDLGITKGVLRLSERAEERRPHLPIDSFLRQLADDQGPNAIAIIMSGTGSDGALGLEFVKGQGGITFAQRPDSAKYDGMPNAALATGCVDFTLAPEEIAAELQRLKRHPYVRASALPEAEEALPIGDRELSEVFALLRGHSGVDFTSYKRTTVKRRVLRRMALHQLEDLATYVQRLRASPAEVEALYQDMLIKVTNFFRDAAVFEALKQDVFPRIMKSRAADNPIRIWVPGCSTGEEAYSLAICWLEFLGTAALTTPLQIFATDVSGVALEKARLGYYGNAISLDVSSERLRRFFVKRDGGGYQINKALRDPCVFARQNLLRDPPFSRLDLISCRNVLIYFEPVLQQKVVPIFHFALKPEGVLVLGAAESVGSLSDLFGTLDKEHRFYSKDPSAHVRRFDFPTTDYESTIEAGKPAETGAFGTLDAQKIAELMLLARLSPSVLVDDQFQVLQIRGHTGDYLEPAQGTLTSDLFKMVRQGLLQPLRTALQQARKTGLAVNRNDLDFTVRGQRRRLKLEVLPVKIGANKPRHYLVVFEELSSTGKGGMALEAQRRRAGGKPPEANKQLRQLRQELAATREYLQSMVEAQEATNAELKCANEEVLSSNEELQSTNEELETAKEELQSSNEELKTANDELLTRNLELAESREYAVAMVDTFSKPVMLLDAQLRVKRANRVFYKIFHSRPEETEERMIWELGDSQWDIPALRALLQEVLPKKTELTDFEVEHDFPVIGHRTMLLDAHLAHWGDHHTEMILLAFDDITRRKHAEEERETTISLLRLVNSAANLQEIIGRLLLFLKERSGCEAVGIRLRENGDFTYFASSGLSPEFVQAENRLRAADTQDKAARDNLADPALECMCGVVLDGRTNPALPYFTGKGSFWTNSANDIVADATRQLGPMRGRCVREGYESLALIPLRAGGETYGLLQFNDKRKNCFTPELIRLLENLADNVASALAHRWVADALRAAQERLSLAAEAAQLGTWEYDPATRKVIWSEQCQAILGVPAGTPGHYETFDRCLHPEDRARVAQHVERALDPTGAGKYEAEYRVVWPDGSIHWVSSRGQAYFEGTGTDRRAIRMLGAVLDITVRKQRDDQERLLLTEKAANKAKDEFIAMLSHELRTPLSAILVWSKLLSGGELDPAASLKAAEGIERNARAQTQLINDLLDVSRIVQGKYRIERREVALLPAVEAALETVRASAEAKCVRLQSSLKDVGTVTGDAVRLQQVVWNLLQNAIKYTPKGGHVEVKLTKFPATGGTGWAQITVTDSGIGIRPEFLPHLFERFSQATTGSTRRYSGLGIGLAIVRHVVELHEGTVHAESAGEGQGATFVVRLPMSAEHAGAVEEGGQVAKPAAEESVSLDGVRILVVDDDPDAREWLQTALRVCHAEVRAALGAAEGLEVLKQWQPDVLISDIGMPGEDGFSLIKKVRELRPEQGGQIPAVALTSYVRDEDRLRVLSAGFQLHLPKPTDIIELMQAVATLARSRQAT